MEQSPSEASSVSAGYESPRRLWDRNIHYSVQQSLPMGPVLNQMDTVLAVVYNSFFVPQMWDRKEDDFELNGNDHFPLMINIVIKCDKPA
jgi:hypothetical protein